MLVSVVIPVYKVEKYIIRCIDSVLNQTYRQLEVILIDDCSTDDSVNIVKRHIKNSSKSIDIIFKYLYHEHNRGLSAARNSGVDAATGDYIFFLDSDDEITPDCIETLVSLSDNGSIDYIRGSHHLLTNEKVLFQEYVLKDMTFLDPLEIIRQYTSYKLIVTAWNALIKSYICRKFKFYEGLIHEDVLWTYVIMNNIRSLVSTSHVTYYNYGRPGSIINSLTDKRSNDNMMIIFKEMDHMYNCGLLMNVVDNRRYIVERKSERLIKICESRNLLLRQKVSYFFELLSMRFRFRFLGKFLFMYAWTLKQAWFH